MAGPFYRWQVEGATPARQIYAEIWLKCKFIQPFFTSRVALMDLTPEKQSLCQSRRRAPPSTIPFQNRTNRPVGQQCGDGRL